MGMGADPNVKRIALVSRTGVLIGLGLLVVGVLFAIARPGPIKSGDIALGGGLVLLGAVFICFRVGVMLDRQRRTATTWWGVLVPLGLTRHPISQVHFVSISREERSDYKRTYEVFPVRLEKAGADSITVQVLTIQEPRDHDKARHLAEDVAEFMHLGIRDRSSGTEIVRETGTFDQSLRQRLRRTDRSMPLPALPPQPRAIFNYGGTRAPTTIEIPPVGRTALWFLLAISLAGGIVMLSELFIWLGGDLAEMDMRMRALFTFLLVLGIILPLPLRTAILRERLVISPDNLIVTQRDIFGTKTTRLMGGEIEEVEVDHARRGIYGRYATFDGGTSRVVVRSDRGSIELGAALSNPQEINWLRDVLVHVLNSASPAMAG